jgi:hypothetical protein
MEGTVERETRATKGFRVRYEDGQYLGCRYWIQVHECEAFCFDSPTVAAETAIKGELYPFTVEEAR